jgi:peptide/nickel transport system substrate-binding protein
VNTIDDKLERAVGAGEEERKRLYHEIQHQVIDQAYVVPLYIPAFQLGLSRTVHGVNWATNAKPNFYDAWISR